MSKVYSSDRFPMYYDVLGVGEDATPEEISEAHRGLQKKYHPDVGTGMAGQEKFKDIEEAFNILKSPSERLKYDMALRMYRAQTAKAPSAPPTTSSNPTTTGPTQQGNAYRGYKAPSSKPSSSSNRPSGSSTTPPPQPPPRAQAQPSPQPSPPRPASAPKVTPPPKAPTPPPAPVKGASQGQKKSPPVVAVPTPFEKRISRGIHSGFANVLSLWLAEIGFILAVTFFVVFPLYALNEIPYPNDSLMSNTWIGVAAFAIFGAFWLGFDEGFFEDAADRSRPTSHTRFSFFVKALSWIITKAIEGVIAYFAIVIVAGLYLSFTGTLTDPAAKTVFVEAYKATLLFLLGVSIIELVFKRKK